MDDEDETIIMMRNDSSNNNSNNNDPPIERQRRRSVALTTFVVVSVLLALFVVETRSRPPNTIRMSTDGTGMSTMSSSSSSDLRETQDHPTTTTTTTSLRQKSSNSNTTNDDDGDNPGVAISGSSSEQAQAQQQVREEIEKTTAVTESELLAVLTEKLTTPREFAMEIQASGGGGVEDVPQPAQQQPQLAPNQFLHLHHMKTGGTSMDYYLRCAMERLKADQGYKIPYGSIHECNKWNYDRCKSGEDARCQKNLADAALMSYCAPLKDLPHFSWGTTVENGVDLATPPSHGAITVLRHPVDRVWSMFRFQTKECFKCMPLTDIYDMMDAGDLSELEPTCYQQLVNHQVANLLSTEWNQDFTVLIPSDRNSTTEEDEQDDIMLAEAIENMKSFFTVIGLTEQLDTTIEIASQVFPWMKPKVDWSGRECTLSHANSSPRNNGCGPDHTHWNLPSEPDAATRAAIEAHNQLDLKLYAAAVQHFELQKRAVRFDEEAG